MFSFMFTHIYFYYNNFCNDIKCSNIISFICIINKSYRFTDYKNNFLNLNIARYNNKKKTKIIIHKTIKQNYKKIT